MQFRSTKPGVAICPFFTWTSENIEGEGHTTQDVNLTYCVHPSNSDKYEGNCQEKLCPLMRRSKNGTTQNASEEIGG